MAAAGNEAVKNGVPHELAALLQAPTESARATAWTAFLDRYSRLLLHTVYAHSRDYDGAMDRYAFVLEQLQDGEHARLQRFAANGRGRFTTWLVVVARRLCDDYHRRKYGRLRAGDGIRGERARERHEARRRLADLVTDELRLDAVPAMSQSNPEMTVRRNELNGALDQALSHLETVDRLLLRLRFEEEFSAHEIADFLGLPSQFHVYRRLKSALKQVRENLIRAGIADPRP